MCSYYKSPFQLIWKTGICLYDSYYKSLFQNLQQTLYRNSLDFENRDSFVTRIIDSLFGTSSTLYTKVVLILKTVICLCDAYYKSLFSKPPASPTQKIN